MGPGDAVDGEFVDLAASRMNQLELYTEHTFAYTGHAAVWAGASPLTADDMRWLDALCAAHGAARRT